MESSHPLIEVAIAPKHERDTARLRAALARRAADAPSLQVASDKESGLIVLGGASEAQLDREVDGLRRASGIDLHVGAPHVAYREALTRRVERDHTHKGRIGDAGRFARVRMVFAPNRPGAGNLFRSEIVGDAVPQRYIPAVERGVASVLRAGILMGAPLVDVEVILVDGAYHDVDSSALAFEIAARSAFREALTGGASVLTEPVMRVEVVTPPDYAGACIGDLNARRGQVEGRGVRGDAAVFDALVPLADMIGYADHLRFVSQGQATFTMRFDHDAPVTPPDGGRPPPAAAAALAR